MLVPVVVSASRPSLWCRCVLTLQLPDTNFQVPFAIGGSGSAYITGFFDKYWIDGMSEGECVEFCKRAVAHAFARDGSSGGSVRLVVVTEKGGVPCHLAFCSKLFVAYAKFLFVL